MDREPLAPPFAVGARLRYCGAHASFFGWGKDGGVSPIVAPGVEVVIDAVRPGHRGTLRQISDADGPAYFEDTGDPILDTTRDGYSIFHVTDPVGQTYGRCIDHETASEWVIL